MSGPSFILASTSPRRSEMLTRAGFSFRVVAPPEDDNDGLAHLAAGELVLTQGLAKGRAVARENPDQVVLAADTVVALYGRILGKPAHREEAEAMLADLSGLVHEVLTGFCLLRGGETLHAEAVRTEVEFRPLSPDEIRAYAATGSPLDKAGAYGIQDLGGGLVKSIRGSYTNVVGLPLAEVIQVLAGAGICPAREVS